MNSGERIVYVGSDNTCNYYYTDVRTINFTSNPLATVSYAHEITVRVCYKRTRLEIHVVIREFSNESTYMTDARAITKIKSVYGI
jgi:hypothetical protein